MSFLRSLLPDFLSKLRLAMGKVAPKMRAVKPPKAIAPEPAQPESAQPELAQPEPAPPKPPPKPPMSLAGRLVLVALGWSALVLVVLGWGLSALFARSVEAAFDRELAAAVDALAASTTYAKPLEYAPNIEGSGQSNDGLVAQPLAVPLSKGDAGSASEPNAVPNTVPNNVPDSLSATQPQNNGVADENIAQTAGLSVARPPPDPRFYQPLSGRYWQVGDVAADGQWEEGVARSRSLFDEIFNVPKTTVLDALANPGQTRGSNLNRGGENLRIAARVIRLPERTTPTLLLVGADRHDIDEAAQTFQYTLAGALMVLILGLIAAIFLQVRLGLKPLRDLGDGLHQIRAGKVDQLDTSLPMELAPLAVEINALISHNQAVVERARTHVGNLAHALKTPLSVLRNEAEVHGDDFGQLVLRQADGMSAQVGHYLKRANAAARAEALGARSPLGPVLEELARTLGKLFHGEGVKLILGPVPDVVFRGEREDLADMLGNLIENACRYGGGLVEVHVRQNNDNRVDIFIDDDGDGLSATEAQAALMRGVRLDETRKGSGLGLSISNELADAYGGTLSLSRSPLGGLRATLDLPLAPL